VFGQLDHLADVFRRGPVQQLALVGADVVSDEVLVLLDLLAVGQVLRVEEDLFENGFVDVQPADVVNIVEILQFLALEEQLDLSLLTGYVDG